MQRRTIIITISILAVALIGLAIYGLFASKNSSTSTQSTYTDPGTGKQIVDNPKYTQSSVDNPDPSRPTFIGFTALVDNGLSQTQADQVQNAIYAYSSKNSLAFKEISLATSSIETPPPKSADPTSYIRFTITVNRSTQYYVNVTYSDFSSCTTHIYTSDKSKLLFTQ